MNRIKRSWIFVALLGSVLWISGSAFAINLPFTGLNQDNPVQVRKPFTLRTSDADYDLLQNDTIRHAASHPGNFLYIPFSHADSLSLLLADSLIRAANQKKQLKKARQLAEGKISLGWFDLDYNKILGYNLYEGFKLGLGGETNKVLSSYFSVGATFSYGSKEQSLRHAEWINLYPKGTPDLRFFLGYKAINMEFGGGEFLEPKSLFNPDNYINLLVKNMFLTSRYSSGFEFRPVHSLNVYLFGDLSKNTNRGDTPFLLEHPFNQVNLTRAGIQVRYAPGIKIPGESEQLKKIGRPGADFYLTVIQGLSIFKGNFSYTRAEFKTKFNLPCSAFGTTTIMVRGGTISASAPVFELFNGYGSFSGTFSLAAPYSFSTMHQNEFLATRYGAIHLRHNFSTWIFAQNSKIRPALIFAQNIGFGMLDAGYSNQLSLRDYKEGFYESGVEVNNLISIGYLSLGAGVYYRYGPYRYSAVADNFGFKLGVYFKF
jgi:hypothetical protein